MSHSKAVVHPNTNTTANNLCPTFTSLEVINTGGQLIGACPENE
jgi:hypothetical protein